MADGRVLVAPVIRSIVSDEIMIEGGLTREDAVLIADRVTATRRPAAQPSESSSVHDVPTGHLPEAEQFIEMTR